MMKYAKTLAMVAVVHLCACGAARPSTTEPKSGSAFDAEPSPSPDPSEGKRSDSAAAGGEPADAVSAPTSLAEPAVGQDRSAVSAPFSEQHPGFSGGSEARPTHPSDAPSGGDPLTARSADAAVQGNHLQATGLERDGSGDSKCRESDAKLSLSIDRQSVSLEDGRLQAKMDGPICSLTLRITNQDGQTILEKAFRHTEPESVLHWSPIPRAQIEKIEVRISAHDGAYQSVFLIPWSVSIDHEEVRFDTNKAVIRDSEVASLNDSLTKINDVLAKVEGKGLGTITLFIAGHTDTQGSDEHNLVLSRSRAQSIARWFMQRGLCIPIAYEGFGETALKKLTADNVDEQANRRVDYILSVEPPTIKKGAIPVWKSLPKGC